MSFEIAIILLIIPFTSGSVDSSLLKSNKHLILMLDIEHFARGKGLR